MNPWYTGGRAIIMIYKRHLSMQKEKIKVPFMIVIYGEAKNIRNGKIAKTLFTRLRRIEVGISTVDYGSLTFTE